MPELAETQLETPAPPAAEPVARIEDDEDEDSDDTIPELEDAGMYCYFDNVTERLILRRKNAGFMTLPDFKSFIQLTLHPSFDSFTNVASLIRGNVCRTEGMIRCLLS